jgi:hypothetical protein
MHHDAASNLPGTVEKIIKPIIQGEAEKVQIAIQGGDDRNQIIRIANILVDAQGKAVSSSMPPANPPLTLELMSKRDHIQSAARSESILNRVDDVRRGKKTERLRSG